MKLVISYATTTKQLAQIMEFVDDTAIYILSELPKEIADNNDHICIYYNHQHYVFNRYCLRFVKRVEEFIKLIQDIQQSDKAYEGPFFVCNLDDRFTHPKYYTIEKKQYREVLTVHTSLIIDDLYYNRLMYETKKEIKID